MSSKVDLQGELNEIGYELGLFTSKETLSNIRRLHSFVLTERNLNVAALNDLELRKSLIKHGLLVGPVTNHTRPIYQRKLLEILTNEKTEGLEYDSDESVPELNNENTLYPNLSGRKPFSYGLPKTYDEPMTIRNDYRATTTSTRNTYGNRNLSDNSNEIRPRIATKPNEQKQTIQNSSTKKVNDNEKQPVATKSGGTFLYAGITIAVALIVFVLYFLFEK